MTSRGNTNSKVRAQRHTVGSRWRGSTRIIQRGRGFECAILCAGQIPTPQSDAPRILGSAPFDGRIQHIVARLAQTIVRVPRKSAVVVIAEDEVETSARHRHAIDSTDGSGLLGGSQRIKAGRIAHALRIAADWLTVRAEGGAIEGRVLEVRVDASPR
jgi:hypothetical protein